MKIYIFADLEGISGVSSSDFVKPEGRCFRMGQEYMTADINACAQACFEAGAQDVVVRDGHGSGNNVLWDRLLPGVKLVQGGSGTGTVRLPGLDGADAVILLGYHAMAGTAEALLEHTYSSASIQNIWLNGEKIGEFALDCAIASEHKVPVIMTSGDNKLCEEAKKFLPSVVTCQVKTALNCQSAILLGAAEAHALIAEKTKKAIASLGSAELKIFSPATIRYEMCERCTPPNGTGHCQIDGRTSEFTAPTVEEAFFGIRRS